MLFFAVLTFVYYRTQLLFDGLSFFSGSCIAFPAITLGEQFMHSKRSLFRTIFFQMILFVVSLFAFTTRVKPFGKGVILALLFTSIYLQFVEHRKHGHIYRWLGPEDSMSISEQRLYLLSMIIFFFLLVIFFH